MKRLRAVVTLAMCLCSWASGFGAAPKRPSSEADVRALYSGDADTRTEAARRLHDAGPKVVPLLVKVICERDKRNFDVAWPLAAELAGEWKAADAASCLVSLLMYNYPSIGPVLMKSDETLSNVDAAFVALAQIGDGAVTAIRRRLPFLYPEQALMAVRVLRIINTPSAREAAEAYVAVLQDQIRFTRQILEDFGAKR